MNQNGIILELKDVSKNLSNQVMIQKLNFSMKKGERVAFIGETGSGKTSILKMIGGLMQPDSGEIYFLGEKVKGPDETLIPGHGKIAYLSQHFELRNNYYVHELLSYANELSQKKSEDLYRICRINHLLDRYSDELSGGEKQRVALAILLTRSPKLLLLDEPYSNLDFINKGIIKNVIAELSNEFDFDTILISHEPTDVLPWAKTIYVLKSGEIAQSGSAFETYHFPVDEYNAALLGRYSLVTSKHHEPFVQFKHKIKGKQFIRPDYLSIDEKKESPYSGKVIDIEYFGSYQIVSLEFNEEVLYLHHSHSGVDIKSGEILHFKNRDLNIQ